MVRASYVPIKLENEPVPSIMNQRRFLLASEIHIARQRPVITGRAVDNCGAVRNHHPLGVIGMQTIAVGSGYNHTVPLLGCSISPHWSRILCRLFRLCGAYARWHFFLHLDRNRSWFYWDQRTSHVVETRAEIEGQGKKRAGRQCMHVFPERQKSS